MTPSSNPLIALLDLFRSPVDCFTALHQRPKWALFPYLLLILTPFGLWGSYFNQVDLTWLQETLRTQIPQLTQENQLDWLSREVLLAGEVFSDILGRTASIFMLALWLNLATKNSNAPQPFGKWLTASCFILLPTLIGDLASYLNILFNPSQVLPNAADLNSLNAFIKLPMNHPWAAFASSIPLLAPWYIALSYIAVSLWCGIERAKAIVIATLPWLLVVTVWPLLILTA
ncbi:YIP1 family protein [Photobacterium sp. TLY01]|uniref:YIP1 family protein n=1 Tax=Photobacterium sp. TLY01 TaxID=2907534 RepID=UPI001F448313|nr:YIP1 family protein [Photobacterium sp. TLY01]UIP28543.1 YIP1 family protein [Photobacterium sp. TLY01]